MEIYVTGLNHKRAPVELREKLAVDDATIQSALAELQKAFSAQEMVILSTCNRVELYSVHEEAPPSPEAITEVLARRHSVASDALAPALYHHQGAEAVRHLFRVTSSLDSMVLGETQIIGQVKDAYLAAQAAGSTGRVFNRLFQQALAVAKRVHTTTSLGEKNISVPSVASRLAEKIFQDLARKQLVIIGAGEMGELTVGAFRNRGVTKIHVVNRSIENARSLAAKHGGQAHGLEELANVLPLGDIVIACIRADNYVLNLDAVRAALAARRHDPMFLIDIAVPRNIHPEVNEIDNVYLFNIDNLEQIVQQNVVDREKEVSRCTPLVEEETQAFWKDMTPPDVTALLTQLRERLHAIGDEELKRTLGKLNGLSPEHKQEVQELTRRIVNKILHPPTEALRGAGADSTYRTISELVRKLFGISR
ncbi:MAG TPA: glutamyl-tRNA reductase [Planctomycetota bacterium]|nr:glutamyl-tRNA reductase [Planctomycetota bacterium]